MGSSINRYMSEHRFSLEKWSDVHSLIMITAVLLCVILASVYPLFLVAIFSFSLLVVTQLSALRQYRFFAGPANWLTFIRLIVTIYATTNFSSLSVSVFFVLMLGSMLLDVLDGFVARKLSISSEFGRVFDMEADAYFVMALGLYFYFTTDLGLWLLLPGLMRYVYRLCILAFPQPSFSESKKQYAAVLAGLNFVILLAAILLPQMQQLIALVFSTGIVVASFCISFYEYFTYAKNH